LASRARHVDFLGELAGLREHHHAVGTHVREAPRKRRPLAAGSAAQLHLADLEWREEALVTLEDPEAPLAAGQHDGLDAALVGGALGGHDGEEDGHEVSFAAQVSDFAFSTASSMVPTM
jgi:hypothetical protein